MLVCVCLSKRFVLRDFLNMIVLFAEWQTAPALIDTVLSKLWPANGVNCANVLPKPAACRIVPHFLHPRSLLLAGDLPKLSTCSVLYS